MTFHDDHRPADDVSDADAAEQRRTVDDGFEDAGLDPDQVADLLQRDADPADIIDQAIAVPWPEGDDGAY